MSKLWFILLCVALVAVIATGKKEKSEDSSNEKQSNGRNFKNAKTLRNKSNKSDGDSKQSSSSEDEGNKSNKSDGDSKQSGSSEDEGNKSNKSDGDSKQSSSSEDEVNIPPVANVSVINPVVGTGEVLNLDASQSEDTDGRIVAYSWTLTNLSTEMFLDNITSPTPTFMTNEEGTYELILTVTDDDGAIDSIAVIITVKKPNQPPFGGILQSDFSIFPGDIITLDGDTLSFDPDGFIETFYWFTFDPEHEQYLSSQYGGKVTFSTDVPGEYYYALTITDNEGEKRTVDYPVYIRVYQETDTI